MPDLDLVRDGLRERERPPDVVQPGAEDGETVRAVAAELRAEVAADAVEVRLQALALVVGEVAAVRAVRTGALVQEGVQAGSSVTGRRRDARVEIEVEADRTALLRLEAGEVPQLVPSHGPCHRAPPVGFRTGHHRTPSEHGSDGRRLSLET